MKKIVILVGIIAVLSGTIIAQQIKKDSSRNGNNSKEQRYQIVFSPFVRADTFLLDTQTGRVWSWKGIIDNSNKKEGDYWCEEHVENNSFSTYGGNTGEFLKSLTNGTSETNDNSTPAEK